MQGTKPQHLAELADRCIGEHVAPSLPKLPSMLSSSREGSYTAGLCCGRWNFSKLDTASMKTFLLNTGALLSFASTAQTISYTNVSEVPLYGLSPPVYPTRESGGSSTIIAWLTIYSRGEWRNRLIMASRLCQSTLDRGSAHIRREGQHDTRPLWTVRWKHTQYHKTWNSGIVLRRRT